MAFHDQHAPSCDGNCGKLQHPDGKTREEGVLNQDVLARQILLLVILIANTFCTVTWNELYSVFSPESMYLPALAELTAWPDRARGATERRARQKASSSTRARGVELC